GDRHRTFDELATTDRVAAAADLLDFVAALLDVDVQVSGVCRQIKAAPNMRQYRHAAGPQPQPLSIADSSPEAQCLLARELGDANSCQPFRNEQCDGFSSGLPH